MPARRQAGVLQTAVASLRVYAKIYAPYQKILIGWGPIMRKEGKP